MTVALLAKQAVLLFRKGENLIALGIQFNSQTGYFDPAVVELPE